MIDPEALRPLLDPRDADRVVDLFKAVFGTQPVLDHLVAEYGGSIPLGHPAVCDLVCKHGALCLALSELGLTNLAAHLMADLGRLLSAPARRAAAQAQPPTPQEN